MKVASLEVVVLNFPFKAVFETTFLRERLWKGGGRVILPEGPGLGVEVDEAYVRKHAVAVRMP